MSAEDDGRSQFRPDLVRLAVLGLVAVGVHGWLIAHTAVPARDSLGFARTALNLSDPAAGAEPGEHRGRLDVIRENEHPPGFPAAVWATQALLQSVCDRSPAECTLLATQLASAAAAVLLVIPTYLTGRLLFGRDAGFAGALLFQVLPVPARVTSDGLSEGVYLLAAGTALMLGVRAVCRPGAGAFLLCGVATGAAYLVRPEGLMVGVGVGLVTLAAGVARTWPRGQTLGRLAALGFGVVLISGPYMALIGGLTKKKSGEYLTDPLTDQPPGLWQGKPAAHARPAPPVLLAEWWNPEQDRGKNRTLWAAGAVAKETIKSLHYVVGALALVTLVARRRLLAPAPGVWVLLAVAAVNLAVLLYLGARVGYVSERHTVLVALIACTAAGAGLGPANRACAAIPVVGRFVLPRKPGAVVLLAVAVAAALPYTLKPLHPEREGHRHAGRWLAEHAAPDEWIIDPFVWAEWYAGRTHHRRARFDGRPEYVWVVWERGKNPHSRLPRWDRAAPAVKGQHPVYVWPEDAPAGATVVEVYRVRRETLPRWW